MNLQVLLNTKPQGSSDSFVHSNLKDLQVHLNIQTTRISRLSWIFKPQESQGCLVYPNLKNIKVILNTKTSRISRFSWIFKPQESPSSLEYPNLKISRFSWISRFSRFSWIPKPQESPSFFEYPKLKNIQIFWSPIHKNLFILKMKDIFIFQYENWLILIRSLYYSIRRNYAHCISIRSIKGTVGNRACFSINLESFENCVYSLIKLTSTWSSF